MTGPHTNRNDASGRAGMARGRQPVDVRQVLQSLPRRTPSEDLKVQLRVLASREASRRRTVPQGKFAAMWHHFNEWMSELMRPIAIPTAGGFVSALLLFGMLSPSLAVRGVAVESVDIPTGLYIGASVESSLPLAYEGESLLVEVALDKEGRMIDYSVPEGQLSSPSLRRSIENHLLTMVFNPATTFGQPTAAKLKVWLRTNRIDIRG